MDRPGDGGILDKMNALHRSPRIRFTRGRGRIAVLALNGSTPAALREALSWGRANFTSVLSVAVDGGLRTWRAIRRPCDLFVGDADSARSPAGIESIVYDPNKGFSDLSGALTELHDRRVAVVCVAGLTGGRLDHEWVNLHELAAHAKNFAGILSPTARGWVVVTAAGASIDTKPGQPFTLLALAGRARVRLRGARWDLDDEWVAPGSRGLSNRSGRSLRLGVERGVACLIFPNV
jgi:thiamine pyrophosphokinase